MRHTLLISVAALALAAGSTAAMSQGSPAAGPAGGAGAIGASPSAGPAGAGATTAPGGQNGQITETPAPGKAAQDRTIPEKKSSQQVPANGKLAPMKQGQAANARHDGNRQGTNERNEGAKQGANEHQQAGTKQGAAERPMTSKNVSLTTEQKTTIRKTVLTSSAPRVSGHVDFDIRVGVAVPRTVRFAPVPVTLITIEPEWRGYDYFVYADQIIIVNPRTLEIVAVLDV